MRKIEMRNKKYIILLILLVFPTIYGIKLIADASSSPTLVLTDMPESIRKGYDLVNDDVAFPKICQFLRDSLLACRKNRIEMMVLTDINMINYTVDWSLVFNEDFEPIKCSDLFFVHIDIDKGKKIKINNNSVHLSEICELARSYIFYPDSTVRKRIFSKKVIDQVGEVELSRISAVMRVEKKNAISFSDSDWRFFFDCLRELIELCEDERNKMSQVIWKKDYTSLSFEEKNETADFSGYHITIEFY